MFGGGVKTSQTKSDKFEVAIKNNLEKFISAQDEPFNQLEVSRYEGTDTKFYSDVRVTNPRNGSNVWIEVKENKYACFAGPSMKFRDGKWECTTIDEGDPLGEFYVDAITKGAEKFVKFCRSYLKKDDIVIPKDLSPSLIKAWKDSGSVEDTDNDVQFITDKIQLDDFGEKIAQYYKTAKYEPVYYMQVDDELYIIDPQNNPLGLHTKDGGELRSLSDAYRLGRIQFRAKGIDKKVDGGNKYYYSIVCDVKILSDDENDNGKTEYECSFKTQSKFPVAAMSDNHKQQLNESNRLFRKGFEILLEEYAPDSADECNEFGERWTKLPDDSPVVMSIASMLDEIAIEPDEPGYDNMQLGDIHITEDDVYIATIYGGCNGGYGIRNLSLYLSAVKKFVNKVINAYGKTWLVDWKNDCADDVWTLRIAFNAADRDSFAVESEDEAESDIGGEVSDYVPEDGVKIWIDDIREAPSGFKWFKTVRDFVEYCYKNGVDDVTLIDTDHDAGEFQQFGGDYVRCFEYLENCGCRDLTIHIHSSNPIGANNIRSIISRNKDRGWKEIKNS